MNCKYFGRCGSCKIYEDGYDAQLQMKIAEQKDRFQKYFSDDFEVFTSLDAHYRARAEFRIWHNEDTISYAMTSSTKEVVPIDECPQVNLHISKLMPKLLLVLDNNVMKNKLFGVDFLSSKDGSIVVSLLYHKKLDEIWQDKAKDIADKLNISIVGRSRKQKVIIGDEFVVETLDVKEQKFRYKHIENSFTQPNTLVNEKMISWALDAVDAKEADLLELYCGSGNFTLPFATKVDKVLATEISKASINAAKENMVLNGIKNIEFVRMSVEEFVDALDGGRVYNRMKHIDLKDYNIKTVFVDPPRAGIDEFSCNFISRYDTIIYISCNPETLKRDLEILSKTHKVEKMAIFDQFAYTNHLEMGVVLKR